MVGHAGGNVADCMAVTVIPKVSREQDKQCYVWGEGHWDERVMDQDGLPKETCAMLEQALRDFSTAKIADLSVKESTLIRHPISRLARIMAAIKVSIHAGKGICPSAGICTMLAGITGTGTPV